MKKLGLVVAAAVFASTFLLAAQASASVYWSNFSSGAGTTLGQANLDGTNPNQSFVTGASGPLGMAVDSQYIYWTSSGGTIGRANLDGTAPNPSFITDAGLLEGLAVNGQYIYWSNISTNTIGRANLDGTAPNPSFIKGASAPTGVAINGQHIYWSNFSANTIGQANLDGSEPNQSLITGAINAGGVAVNGQHIYWSDNAGTIGRANLDGSEPNQSFITGATSPRGVTVDRQYIYWANLSTGTIGRANLDGTAPNQSFINGIGSLFDVAVDGGPAGTATPSIPSMTFASQPLNTYSTQQTLTVTDTGHGTLQIAKAQVTAGDTDDFLITTDTCSGTTLWPREACTIDVRFGPTAVSPRSATLTLTSNDPTSPLSIALQGIGGLLPQGPAGSPGPTGAQGPAGKDGQVELVTCKPVTSTVIKKVKGKRKKVKVTKQKCTTKNVAGPLTFTTSSMAHAALSRAGVTYATGTAIRTGQHPQVLLQPGRTLAPGRYRLTVTSGDGRRSSYAVSVG